jgi:hypothetical protein
MGPVRGSGARSLQYSLIKFASAIEEALVAVLHSSTSSPSRNAIRAKPSEPMQKGKEGGGWALALQRFQESYQVGTLLTSELVHHERYSS